MLLVVFVHGFKGTDETFGDFPKRLEHILAATVHQTIVHCVVFPAYETKGDLAEAVERFADWLTTLTIQKEAECGGGAGSVKIVLCGHSMGGLLIADTLLEFIKNRSSPLWPRIIACIAFDTPYLGLHPNVVKNTVTKAAEYVGVAQTVGSAFFGAFAGLNAQKVATSSSNSTNASSAWGLSHTAFAIGGALLAGAGAWYHQEQLNFSFTWASDHMKFVSSLWDEPALKDRMKALANLEAKGVVFRAFYVFLPATPLVSESRTFIVVPRTTAQEYRYFIQAKNTIAGDEIQAHMGIFAGKTNDNYYDLGLTTAKIIREALVHEEQLSQAAE